MNHDPEIRQKLFDQFSRSVISDGWPNFSCTANAGASGVDIKTAFLTFRDRYSYVTELVRRIDVAMLEAQDSQMSEEAPRERLFDIIMGRFDAMQPHRALILALSKAARRDPMLSLHLLGLSRLTAEWFLDSAHISPAGLGGMVRSKGALLAYARAFATWMEDDSADFSKTMTVLDKTLKTGEKALKRASKLACIVPRMRERCRSSRSKDTSGESAKTDGPSVSEGPSVDDGSMAPMPS